MGAFICDCPCDCAVPVAVEGQECPDCADGIHGSDADDDSDSDLLAEDDDDPGDEDDEAAIE